MIALEFLETKDVMNKLLLSSAFDHFCLVEAVIATFQTVTIDGHVNEDYYDKDLVENLAPYNTWEKVKPFCLDLIKGKRTPLNFRITLTLTPDNIRNVIESAHLSMEADQVTGLLLNFKYDGVKLSCVTGTSLNIFSLDKSLEQEWDTLAKKFFKKQQIVYEES